MKAKTRDILCQAVNSVIFAGVIVFFIGLYYSVVKAGIPYQDPPLELQIEYAVNMGIGEVLVGKGFTIGVCGGAVRLLLGLVLKKQQRDREDGRQPIGIDGDNI